MIETSSPGSASDRESERSESRAARQAHGGAPWSEEELRSWAEDWTADDGDSGGRTGEPFAAAERAVAKGERQRILRRARAWSLWQWLMVVFEYAVGIGALVWSFAMARVERSPSAWVLFAILILLVGSALVVTAWNRRGTWRPENTSTRAFLELEILREERKIYTAAWLLPGFFVFEVVLLLPWLLWHHSGDPATGDPAEGLLRSFLFLAFSAIAIFGGCAFYARRSRYRLQDLERLHDELYGAEDGVSPQGNSAGENPG